MLRALLALSILVLAGCGSGGGHSSGHTPPPPPPPPPVVLIDHYDAVIGTHGGDMVAQGNTIVQYTPSTDTLVFQTVLGPATVTSTRRVWFSGKEYAINFAPASNILIMVDVLTSTDYATWTITLVAAAG